MKPILHKKQLQTVMILMAVVFLLACGVAYTVSARNASPVGGGNVTGAEKPQHEQLRNARASANERLAWETNLGGTGDESPVGVFTKNNEIYVFGNTNSSDLDFAGLAAGKTRGFGARLSLSGRTLGFTIFDFTVAKAIPTGSGFAVAGNEGSVAGLYLLSDTLTVTGKASMPPTTALTACGLYVFDNRFFLFAESFDPASAVTKLLLHVYTLGLSLEREKVFAHTYSLTLLDVLPYNDGYLLAASAYYQGLGYLTVARFNMLGEPAYTDFNLGYPYRATAFAPLGLGYAATCDNNGNCELLTIGNNLAKTGLRYLTESPNANKKTLFYANGMYAFTGRKLIELSDEGRSVGEIDFAASEVSAFANNGVGAFVTGPAQNGLLVACIGKQKSEVFPLAATDATRAVLCAGADSVLLVADVHAKSADCGDFFGGSDVWVTKVSL